MEIKIIDKNDKYNMSDFYVLSLGGKFTITTTVIDNCGCDRSLKEWIRQIDRIYAKKGRQNLVVGISADNLANYAGSSMSHFKKDKDSPFELLQLSVGEHCLVYMDTDQYPPPDFINYPKVLKDFFANGRNTFVGVGIEKIAEKMERLHGGCLIPKRVELRELVAAGEKDVVNKDKVRRCSLSQLAKVVMGEEVDFVKPKRIKWCTDDMVMYAATEAFLASKIGAKLLKNSH